MPAPPSVVKIKKDGVEFVSNVDRAKYTLNELERAALKEIAKLVRRRMLDKLRKLPGMRRNRRLWSSTQYWVRRLETDLQIGFKHGTWYGVEQELGTSKQPKREVLRSTVLENVDMIRLIAARYIRHIEDELRAEGIIDDREETGDEHDA